MTQLEYPFMLNVSKYILTTDLINFRCVSQKCTLTENSFINFIPLCFDVYEWFLHYIKSPIYQTPEDVFKIFPNIQTLYISIIIHKSKYGNKYNFDDIINRIFKFWPCLKRFKLKIKLVASINSDIEFNEFEPDIKETLTLHSTNNLDVVPTYLLNNFQESEQTFIIEHITDQYFNECIYPLFDDILNRIRYQLPKRIYLSIVYPNYEGYEIDYGFRHEFAINKRGEMMTIYNYDSSFETKYFNDFVQEFRYYIRYFGVLNVIDIHQNNLMILNNSIDGFRISCNLLSLPNVEVINTGTIIYTKIIKAPKLKKIGHKCISCYMNLNDIEHYNDSCFNQIINKISFNC